MSSDAGSKIHVDDIDLTDLINLVATGDYRIPQFQRDFVWPKSKVLELFDSIYQEFPIGSFFLWKAGREHNRLFRQVPGLDLPDVKHDDDVWYIIDGQQRITSLYVALKGLQVGNVDYSKICFDLEKQVFADRRPDGKRYIAVHDIWGPDGVDLFDVVADEHKPVLKRCWKVLQKYPISIVEVWDKDLTAVCKIFQRINQSGKRLDRFDLVAAMTFTTDFDLRARFKEDVAAPLEKRGFGSIDTSIVTQLLALKVHGQCTERYEFDLKAEDIKGNWKAAVTALLLAADTLRKNMGVITADYLPYNALLTLLAYYFMASGKKALPSAEMQWVRQWFWQASFAQYYGAASPTQMGRDKPMFDKLAEGEIPEFRVPVMIDVPELVRTRMTWRGSAIRNALLCLLAHLQPLDLENNSPMDLVNIPISEFTKSEKHHIFPKAFLDQSGPADAEIHALPNFCFLAADLNKRISATKPSVYMTELAGSNPDLPKTARTHLIPTGADSGIADDGYLKFLQARGQLILDEIGRLCGGITTPREEERQAAVKDLETRIRDCIHTVLSDAVGEAYWKSNIPADIREGADQRIKRALKEHPDLQPEHFQSARPRLDYLNVPDYRMIIENGSNWKHFKPIFRSTDDVRNHIKAFNDYRNSVMHSRSDMTEYIQKAGETAIIWLNTVLSSEDEPQDGEGQENE